LKTSPIRGRCCAAITFLKTWTFRRIPDRARFNYYAGAEEVLAPITSLTMTIELPTPASLLIYRVNASNLAERRKRALLRILERADSAYANGRCRLGQQRLRNFRQAVRATVRKRDRCWPLT
jgi:hypothetical protein